jgi:hypothetical protein
MPFVSLPREFEDSIAPHLVFFDILTPSRSDGELPLATALWASIETRSQ